MMADSGWNTGVIGVALVGRHIASVMFCESRSTASIKLQYNKRWRWSVGVVGRD